MTPLLYENWPLCSSGQDYTEKKSILCRFRSRSCSLLAKRAKDGCVRRLVDEGNKYGKHNESSHKVCRDLVYHTVGPTTERRLAVAAKDTAKTRVVFTLDCNDEDEEKTHDYEKNKKNNTQNCHIPTYSNWI